MSGATFRGALRAQQTGRLQLTAIPAARCADEAADGTGFSNVTAGLSMLKTYDPVVLLGSLSYTTTSRARSRTSPP